MPGFYNLPGPRAIRLRRHTLHYGRDSAATSAIQRPSGDTARRDRGRSRLGQQRPALLPGAPGMHFSAAGHEEGAVGRPRRIALGAPSSAATTGRMSPVAGSHSLTIQPRPRAARRRSCPWAGAAGRGRCRVATTRLAPVLTSAICRWPACRARTPPGGRRRPRRDSRPASRRAGRARAPSPLSLNCHTRCVPSASTRIVETPASSGITVGEYSDSGVCGELPDLTRLQLDEVDVGLLAVAVRRKQHRAAVGAEVRLVVVAPWDSRRRCAPAPSPARPATSDRRQVDFRGRRAGAGGRAPAATGRRCAGRQATSDGASRRSIRPTILIGQCQRSDLAAPGRPVWRRPGVGRAERRGGRRVVPDAAGAPLPRACRPAKPTAPTGSACSPRTWPGCGAFTVAAR